MQIKQHILILPNRRVQSSQNEQQMEAKKKAQNMIFMSFEQSFTKTIGYQQK